VLRVAYATGAAYEWAQHEQLARNVGVSDAEIRAIGGEDPVTSLDEEASLICRVADEISRDVRLSDEALAQITNRYGPREAAELILLVSYYNMVSRFLESTRVEIEPLRSCSRAWGTGPARGPRDRLCSHRLRLAPGSPTR
jgi:4-carboxymuconolactone decarboxylase